MLFAALTHTLTHTGKRTGGTHGTKSFRPHPFCGKNAHKALQIKGWEDFYHLVRMRSAVRIRPAAPKSIENRGFRCFFVKKTYFYVRVKMWVNCLTHTVTHTGKRADGTHGAKRFRPHPFCGKNARKALYTNGRRAFYHLVRMRSAVQIRPAAPKSIENFGFRCFFVVKR